MSEPCVLVCVDVCAGAFHFVSGAQEFCPFQKAILFMEVNLLRVFLQRNLFGLIVSDGGHVVIVLTKM